jgi:fructokinase
LLEGANGLASEIGHLPLPFREEADGPVVPCGCKQQGCLDKTISGGGLARLYAFLTGKEADARTIARMASEGDADALRVLDRYYEVVAKAMVAILHTFDPEIVVVSGGLSALQGLYEEVPKRWGRYAVAAAIKTKFVPARHGLLAGVRGAAWLGREKP